MGGSQNSGDAENGIRSRMNLNECDLFTLECYGKIRDSLLRVLEHSPVVTVVYFADDVYQLVRILGYFSLHTPTKCFKVLE